MSQTVATVVAMDIEDGDIETSSRYSRQDRDRKRKKLSRGPTSREIDVSQVKFETTPKFVTRCRELLTDAGIAFEAERFADVLRLTKELDAICPQVPEAVELVGLALYRQGKFEEAIAKLERFEKMVGSIEQHAVLADCHRGLGDWKRCDDLWEETKKVSPRFEVIEEARIVQAGSLADRGEVEGAIALLSGAPKPKGDPNVHHLRRWYVLANHYESVGNIAQARALFQRIVGADVGFADAVERLAEIS